MGQNGHEYFLGLWPKFVVVNRWSSARLCTYRIRPNFQGAQFSRIAIFKQFAETIFADQEIIILLATPLDGCARANLYTKVGTIEWWWLRPSALKRWYVVCSHAMPSCSFSDDGRLFGSELSVGSSRCWLPTGYVSYLHICWRDGGRTSIFADAMEVEGIVIDNGPWGSGSLSSECRLK